MATNKTKILSYTFKSGNVMEVFCLPLVRGEVAEPDCMWDNYPPSEDDQVEYADVVQKLMVAAFMRHLNDGETDDRANTE